MNQSIILPEGREHEAPVGQDHPESVQVMRDNLILLVPLDDRPRQPGGHAVQSEAGAVREHGLVGRLETELGPRLLRLQRERIEGEGVRYGGGNGLWKREKEKEERKISCWEKETRKKTFAVLKIVF